MNILVCDDDKDIVEAISIYLEQEGHQILKAYDGQQALLVLQKNEVDLLIIDVMMPKLDGIRATLKIREEHSLPIIILSAKSEDADKILGLNVGADDYVTKPFSPLELIARVRSQLRRYTQLGAAVSCERKVTRRQKKPGGRSQWDFHWRYQNPAPIFPGLKLNRPDRRCFEKRFLHRWQIH